MPRKTKAERERIKVTCLWCENIAATHLVCSSCQGPLSEADKAKYLRKMTLDMERAQRKCQCGALIPYEARQGTKYCAYCKQTRLTRKYHQKHPNARINGKRDARSCRRCGANAHGKNLCILCQEKHTNEVCAMKEKRRAAGMCVDCGIAAATNGQKCRPCAVKANKASAESRMIAIADGKCGRCMKRRHSPGRTLCKSCMATKREQNKRTAQ